jgi:RNA polymerase sigma factor (sigma-70 family)
VSTIASVERVVSPQPRLRWESAPPPAKRTQTSATDVADGNEAIEQAATRLQLSVSVGSPVERYGLSEEAALALSTLYQQCAMHALREARRHTTNEADAQDVVHDVFLRLPSFIRQYRSGNFRGWLARAIGRAAIRSRRRSYREWELEEVVAPVADVGESDDASVRVRAAVERLPERLRAVVLMRAYEERSHVEIGRRLGISAMASEVRFCRAVKRLRQTLRT